MIKKIILFCFGIFLLTSTLCFAAGFDSRSFSGLDIDELIEKIYVKVSVTIKIDEKKVKGVVTFKEKGFNGNIICSDKYKTTVDGKIKGENISAKIHLYNVKKDALLYKFIIKGTRNAGHWSLYNGSDVAIAKGSFDNRKTDVLDEALFSKFQETMERVGKTCSLN